MPFQNIVPAIAAARIGASVMKAGLDIAYGEDPSKALNDAGKAVVQTISDLSSPSMTRPWDMLRRL